VSQGAETRTPSPSAACGVTLVASPHRRTAHERISALARDGRARVQPDLLVSGLAFPFGSTALYALLEFTRRRRATPDMS
jgi:hypothetical protein